MKLSDDEVEEGARRLCNSTAAATDERWDKLNEKRREGFRMIVRNLAAALETEYSPAAVNVFLLWMGPQEAK